MGETGLHVERWTGQGGWEVIHDQSGMRVSRAPLRLKRHAEQLITELAATGFNFNRPLDEIHRDLKRRIPDGTTAPYARVINLWTQRALNCCNPASGEHYSPMTYAMNGRCINGSGAPRRS